MKILLRSICLSFLLGLLSQAYAAQPHGLRCDLYFLQTPAQKSAQSFSKRGPKLKEYPLNLKVRIDSSDGAIPPLAELKSKMNLEVVEHLSWVIPSFSKKLFLSLSKDNFINPFGITKDSPSAFEEIFQDYTGGDTPVVPAITVNRQLIGTMEIFSYRNNRIKFGLNLYDQPYRLQMQNEYPLGQWIVVDTPSEVALLFISPL